MVEATAQEIVDRAKFELTLMMGTKVIDYGKILRILNGDTR